MADTPHRAGDRIAGQAENWTAVDRYFEARLLGDDPVAVEVAKANQAAGLQAIDVSPLQAQFLALMVRITGARRILEIGTLGGYSAIAMARALPDDGQLVTLEVDPATAAVAIDNITKAGLAGRIDVRVGAALETLPGLEGGQPFDLIFIDADKRNNAAYCEWAITLARSGSVIIVDNVVRSGGVIDPSKTDPHTAGNRALAELLRDHPQLDATALQTVGAKGWDGFVMAVVR